MSRSLTIACAKPATLLGRPCSAGDARLRHFRRHRRGVVTCRPLLHVAPEVGLDVQHHALRGERAGLLEEQLEVVVVRRHRGGVVQIREVASRLAAAAGESTAAAGST